jgi:hypothetical protein
MAEPGMSEWLYRCTILGCGCRRARAERRRGGQRIELVKTDPNTGKLESLVEADVFAQIRSISYEFDALPSPRDADLLLLGAAKVSHAGGGDGRAWKRANSSRS